jgi:O-acetyl-ADP-ribose deacetylase (regulator of RNase III)
MTTIQTMQADITTLMVDAIVNAANTSLLGGGGVDGAIHRAAGQELYNECLLLHGCETGDSKLTRGYKLPSRYVIHAVGPVWHGGSQNEAQLLASCYRRSLELARENDIKSIAFPCISTGVYGFPIREAVKIAIHEVRLFVSKNPVFEKIIFCCFSNKDLQDYIEVLGQN